MKSRKRSLRKIKLTEPEGIELSDIYKIVDNLQKFITQPAVCKECGRAFYLYDRSGILLLPQPVIKDCTHHSYLDLLTMERFIN